VEGVKDFVSTPRRTRLAAGLAVLAAVVAMALVSGVYVRDRSSLQRTYAQTVKKRDIADAARNAITALQDGEIQVQDYVLTGETIYSEAYSQDLRTWQDEFGTLELEAQHDSAAPMIRDLSKSGAQVVNELAEVVSLHDGGSRDAALDRIRKSSAIVYLEQARDLVAKIVQIDSFGADETDQQLITKTLRSQRRLAAGAAGLFCIILALTLLLIFEIRRTRRLV
jgi:CHASE3 domain sensor protein